MACGDCFGLSDGKNDEDDAEREDPARFIKEGKTWSLSPTGQKGRYAVPRVVFRTKIAEIRANFNRIVLSGVYDSVP